MDTQQLMVSPTEAARRIGVGRTTLYGLIREGQVEPVKIGRRTLIPVVELQRYVANLRAGGAALHPMIANGGAA